LFIAVVTIFQVTVAALQFRREGERESRQATREKNQDLTERMGVDQVSKIMNVVQQTLESRLAVEKEAREEAAKASEQVKDILKEIRVVDDFLKKYQETIRNAQHDIEDTASRLAQTERQGFRSKLNELNRYSQKVDTFETSFEPLAVEKRSFSPSVPYVRGIAAHFANQPERAKKYLLEVVGLHQPQPGESQIDYNRRVANAYYYLGLIESNFGNYRNAIDYFDKSRHIDPKGEDLLTRVLTADTYVMNKEFDQAMPFVTEVEKGLDEIERREGRLRNPDQRLRSRVTLIRATVSIINRQANWHEEALQILKSVHDSDSLYYYATTALAQVYTAQGDTSDAQELFWEAYQTIEHSGDLITVTEVRIRILLLMVAGMCCKHGLKDEKSSEEYLDKADTLRDSLPKIGEKVCTVFSPLSKLNEDSQTIHQHIGLIRKGDVLVDTSR
jgi:tetratricopeptide (TPR) repeat protein